MIKTDKYSRSLISDSELADLLYTQPELSLGDIAIVDPEKYNSGIKSLYLDWDTLNKLEELDITPREFHTQNQQVWWMPEEYNNMDISKYILDQCHDQNELQRAGHELLAYAERDLLPLLRYLKYLIDTMRSNNIVWGVGRGSSVASFVLYLLGVHRIHSLRHNLNFEEFMR